MDRAHSYYFNSVLASVCCSDIKFGTRGRELIVSIGLPKHKRRTGSNKIHLYLPCYCFTKSKTIAIKAKL